MGFLFNNTTSLISLWKVSSNAQVELSFFSYILINMCLKQGC